jgi:hypothetical protein
MMRSLKKVLLDIAIKLKLVESVGTRTKEQINKEMKKDRIIRFIIIFIILGFKDSIFGLLHLNLSTKVFFSIRNLENVFVTLLWCILVWKISYMAFDLYEKIKASKK